MKPALRGSLSIYGVHFCHFPRTDSMNNRKIAFNASSSCPILLKGIVIEQVSNINIPFLLFLLLLSKNVTESVAKTTLACATAFLICLK